MAGSLASTLRSVAASSRVRPCGGDDEIKTVGWRRGGGTETVPPAHLHELRLGVIGVEQRCAAGGAGLEPRALLGGDEDVCDALGVLGL